MKKDFNYPYYLTKFFYGDLSDNEKKDDDKILLSVSRVIENNKNIALMGSYLSNLLLTGYLTYINFDYYSMTVIYDYEDIIHQTIEDYLKNYMEEHESEYSKYGDFNYFNETMSFDYGETYEEPSLIDNVMNELLNNLVSWISSMWLKDFDNERDTLKRVEVYSDKEIIELTEKDFDNLISDEIKLLANKLVID